MVDMCLLFMQILYLFFIFYSFQNFKSYSFGEIEVSHADDIQLNILGSVNLI